MGILYGVLNKDDDLLFAEAVNDQIVTDYSVTLVKPGGEQIDFIQPTRISRDRATGRLSFESGGDSYTVRELREDDGQWISKYKTWLPIAALQTLINGDTVEDLSQVEESIDAFALDDSPYVLGVVYTNNAGRWVRLNGDWVLLAPEDTTYSGMGVINIDPERADEFLALYDDNFVTVQDAEAFEAEASADAEAEDPQEPAVVEDEDAPVSE